MARFLALYWSGSTRGYGFGARFDSTRKALVARGLVSREREKPGGLRYIYALTIAGVKVAKSLPDPRAEKGPSPARHLAVYANFPASTEEEIRRMKGVLQVLEEVLPVELDQGDLFKPVGGRR